MLHERGEYVVVSTAASSIFNYDIDTTQSFVLAVKNPDFSMRQVLRGFAEFNQNEFKSWNLGVQLKSSGDYRILIVEGIPTLNESMSYFRKVVITRSLFEPLGQATYRNFLITGDNLETVLKEEKIEDYIDFFRNNYIRRNQSQDVKGQTDKTPETMEISETEDTGSQSAEYAGPYSSDIGKSNYIVFVVPNEGIDKSTFLNNIMQFNEISESVSPLDIDEKPLDDFRDVIVISGHPDKETAMRYFRNIIQNRDIFTPLGDAVYRNFLITKENFDIFLKEKNITEYMDFYRQNYLEK